ncbi:MAG: hypothetical protein V4644_02425 [Patescibacteria group bacterium]
MQDRLKTTADLDAWDQSCVRLAREYLLWREYFFPKMLRKLGSPHGVILVDRTILSRFMLIRERGDFDWKNLFPNWAKSAGRLIDADLISPEIIFNLSAPKEELLKRLDIADPKYDFRKLLITKKSDWFSDSVLLLPPHIQERIISITSVGDPSLVFHQIRRAIEALFQEIEEKA